MQARCREPRWSRKRATELLQGGNRWKRVSVLDARRSPPLLRRNDKSTESWSTPLPDSLASFQHRGVYHATYLWRQRRFLHSVLLALFLHFPLRFHNIPQNYMCVFHASQTSMLNIVPFLSIASSCNQCFNYNLVNCFRRGFYGTVGRIDQM